jgi:hypothetical protein
MFQRRVDPLELALREQRRTERARRRLTVAAARKDFAPLVLLLREPREESATGSQSHVSEFVHPSLANANRRAVLRLLKERDSATASDVGRGPGISRQAAARHLKHLEQIGFVTSQKVWRARFYPRIRTGSTGDLTAGRSEGA